MHTTCFMYLRVHYVPACPLHARKHSLSSVFCLLFVGPTPVPACVCAHVLAWVFAYVAARPLMRYNCDFVAPPLSVAGALNLGPQETALQLLRCHTHVLCHGALAALCCELRSSSTIIDDEYILVLDLLLSPQLGSSTPAVKGFIPAPAIPCLDRLTPLLSAEEARADVAEARRNHEAAVCHAHVTPQEKTPPTPHMHVSDCNNTIPCMLQWRVAECRQKQGSPGGSQA